MNRQNRYTLVMCSFLRYPMINKLILIHFNKITLYLHHNHTIRFWYFSDIHRHYMPCFNTNAFLFLVLHDDMGRVYLILFIVTKSKLYKICNNKVVLTDII